MPRDYRRHPLVRFFSSIRVGVGLLAAILVYACFASALPQVRGAVEMTEMQIFRHWIFTSLIVLFAFVLILATLLRISFRMVNLGVLTVHTGLLMLVVGSIVYFARKIEGDTLVLSPKVQILSVSGGQERLLGEVLAEAGQSWSSNMPAFGGEIHVDIVEVDRDEIGLPARALLVAKIGTESQNLIASAGTDAELFSGRLFARLNPSRPVTKFYDNETAALYVRKATQERPSDALTGAADWYTMLPIERLPYYRERFLDEVSDTGVGARAAANAEVLDVNGQPVDSKRTTPVAEFAGITLPTGWLEHWRMPVELESTELPFDIRVTGYLPYIARMQFLPVESGGALNPAAQVRLSVGTTTIDEVLFALHPSQSIMPRGIPVEFRWFENEKAMTESLKPMAGPHELYIEVKEPPLKKTLPIITGQTIKLEGTTYQLVVKDIQPNWPLMTPGFEGASSPMASVDVTCEGKSYNRTVIQRFPELSQDIDEAGVRHREGPYDPNLILRYRTSAAGWVTVAAAPNAVPQLAVYNTSGAVDVKPLTVGVSNRVLIMGSPVNFSVTSLMNRAESVAVPVVEPLERRRPNISARSASAIRLEFLTKGGRETDSITRWCMFSQYPLAEPHPIQIRLPGVSDTYEIIYSRLERDLGATIIPGKLSVKFFPGRRNVESWRSDFLVKQGDAPPAPGAVYTNQTCSVGDWTLYQSGAAGDHWSFTILGVGNRHGILTMVIGCTLVTLGCLFAFYVKPVLINRIRRRSEQQRIRLNTIDPVLNWDEMEQEFEAAEEQVPVHSAAGTHA